MTTTGLEAIDKTLHKTNEWLGGIMQGLRTDDRRKAYTALRAVMHALRDRLPVVSVASLAAQLPILIRGVYYDGWHPKDDGKPAHLHTVDEFLMVVEREIPPGSHLDAEAATRAVFFVMAQHLDPNETQKVIQLLPRPLQTLWVAPVEPRDG